MPSDSSKTNVEKLQEAGIEIVSKVKSAALEADLIQTINGFSEEEVEALISVRQQLGSQEDGKVILGTSL